MSTESQINANRLNAQSSTGPKTPEGKAKVSQNAVTHGLTAKQPLLKSENQEEYTLFRDDFFRQHAPIGILEEFLAQRAADTFWRLQRAQNYETAVLNTLIHDAASDNTNDTSCHSGESRNPDLLGRVLLDDFRKNHCLEKILKYEMAIERSFYRSLKELRRLQSTRLCNVDEVSPLHSNSENSKNKENKPNSVQLKPKIPTFDPVKLLENAKQSQFAPDILTQIETKRLIARQLAQKAV